MHHLYLTDLRSWPYFDLCFTVNVVTFQSDMFFGTIELVHGDHKAGLVTFEVKNRKLSFGASYAMQFVRRI